MKGLLALLTILSSGATPSVDAVLAPLEITVGDRVELVLTARLSEPGSDVGVSLPEWGKTFGPAEVIEVLPVERIEADGRIVAIRQRLTLTFFDTGEVSLPPVDTRVTDEGHEYTVTTPLPNVTVRSVLPEDIEDGQQIEPLPPAPLEGLALGSRFWWIAGALLATCLAAFVVLQHASAGLDPADDSFPVVAPMDELRRALAELREVAEPVPLHAGLSLALRRFLGRTLDFSAPESTTTEIRRELRDREVPAEMIREISQLLASCDLVKFARREAGRSAALGRLETVEGLAEGVSVLAEQADTEEAPA